MISRRGIILSGAAGLVPATLALERPSGLMQLRDATYYAGGLMSWDNWMMDTRARSPAVRLIFDSGQTTGWVRYDPGLIAGQQNNKLAHHNRGRATHLEISLWAPNGMRAVTKLEI